MDSTPVDPHCNGGGGWIHVPSFKEPEEDVLILCNIHVSGTPLHIGVQLADASRVLSESHRDSHISGRIYEI